MEKLFLVQVPVCLEFLANGEKKKDGLHPRESAKSIQSQHGVGKIVLHKGSLRNETSVAAQESSKGQRNRDVLRGERQWQDSTINCLFSVFSL